MFKKLFRVLLIALIGFGFTTVTLSAGASKGQKIIIKKLKKPCGFNGQVLATKHTQAEWKAIQDKGELNIELKNLCPNLKKEIKEKYVADVYDFVYKYASDSGNVPS
jgi:hypothetical protein